MAIILDLPSDVVEAIAAGQPSPEIAIKGSIAAEFYRNGTWTAEQVREFMDFAPEADVDVWIRKREIELPVDGRPFLKTGRR